MAGLEPCPTKNAADVGRGFSPAGASFEAGEDDVEASDFFVGRTPLDEDR
jgi:hypothetical protein